MLCNSHTGHVKGREGGEIGPVFNLKIRHRSSMRRQRAALTPLDPVLLLKYFTRSVSENTKGGKNKISY